MVLRSLNVIMVFCNLNNIYCKIVIFPFPYNKSVYLQTPRVPAFKINFDFPAYSQKNKSNQNTLNILRNINNSSKYSKHLVRKYLIYSSKTRLE